MRSPSVYSACAEAGVDFGQEYCEVADAGGGGTGDGAAGGAGTETKAVWEKSVPGVTVRATKLTRVPAGTLMTGVISQLLMSARPAPLRELTAA